MKRIFSIILIIVLLTGCAGNGAAPLASAEPAGIEALTPSVLSSSIPSAPAVTASVPDVSVSPSPPPSRHPDDPIQEYPVPLTGHTRPLTMEEAAELSPLNYYEFSINWVYNYGDKNLGVIKWDRDFSPMDLTEKFQPGKLYIKSKILEHLSSIEWPWDESALGYKDEDRLFIDIVWEREITLEPEPIRVCAVGLYAVDSKIYPEEGNTRSTLPNEDGALYIFIQKGQDEWKVSHRINDNVWRVRTEVELAINESNTCAWIIETPTPGTGTGYISWCVLWRNLLSHQIDFQYLKYYWHQEYPISHHERPENVYNAIFTFVYGLRYDFFSDGTYFIRTPDRLIMQIEKNRDKEIYIKIDDDAYDYDNTEKYKVSALMTMEYMFSSDRYHLISFNAEGKDTDAFFTEYGDAEWGSSGTIMPSYGYHVYGDLSSGF